jgi:hypothetical protein
MVLSGSGPAAKRIRPRRELEGSAYESGNSLNSKQKPNIKY